jgi:hypothetical protein
MNDRGQLVAVYVPDSGPADDSAFIFENGKWHNLQEFIDPKSPWQVTDAIEINNSGKNCWFRKL